MTSIKVKFRPSAIANHEGTIYYQLIHGRKPRQLLTGYHVFPTEWDHHRSTIVLSRSSERGLYLISIRKRIHRDIERLNRIVRNLDYKGLSYTVDDVIDLFIQYSKDYSLFNFMEKIILKLRQSGKIRTSETYTATLKSFKKFLASREYWDEYYEDEEFMLESLSAEILEAYVSWMQQKGLAPNTISFYARVLRAVYNRAVDNDIIENQKPFRKVYTGVDKTVKRALPLRSVKRIMELKLIPYSSLDYARDMFMLSFMLRGMSFIDMAFLKKTDKVNGYVTYRRRKTGQLIIIKWTAEMQMILDKYPANQSDYLLPIIRNPKVNERCAYRNMGYNINYNLKLIGKKLGLAIPLTLYVARHSWASAAKAKGVPISVISEGMGHDSETTTQIYLASLDTSVVDKANNLIIKSL